MVLEYLCYIHLMHIHKFDREIIESFLYTQAAAG